jgi:lipopolysaccharide/colanic/teichoic acid biosynthesis glycosyltransferase
VRRTLDVLVAGTVLAISAPLLLLIAACNWLAIRRVFFRQTRVGRGLTPFAIVKFQTMVDDAQRAGTVTARGDRRITAVGKVLRATKLDELPQLINVLRGEMSLVGPRPLTPNEVAAIPPETARGIYAMAPGMTGIASLAFIDEERVLAGASDPEAAYFQVVLPRKVALEIAYSTHRTWLTDLIILILTPLAGCVEPIRRSAVQWLVPNAGDATSAR